MAWNPVIYNQFKTIRYQPFFDLAALVKEEHLENCVDVGCGTGEQTAILSNQFPKAHFLGIDASAEMLSGSEEKQNEHLQFQIATIEEFAKGNSKYDLIFSNAALQWSDDHKVLFPKLISKLSDKGQFAVQMPMQHENVLNQILLELVSEAPFVAYLGGFKRESPMLTVDDYAQILFRNQLNGITLFVKVYPILAENEATLFDFILGSALVPYFEKLNPEQSEELKAEFLKRIHKAFQPFPAIYPFKRILMYGHR